MFCLKRTLELHQVLQASTVSLLMVFRIAEILHFAKEVKFWLMSSGRLQSAYYVLKHYNRFNIHVKVVLNTS